MYKGLSNFDGPSLQFNSDCLILECSFTVVEIKLQPFQTNVNALILKMLQEAIRNEFPCLF